MSKTGSGLHPVLITAFYFIFPLGFLMQSLCSHTFLSEPLGLKQPHRQPDWLLVVFFHYLSDSEQVTSANSEVAPGGSYRVANLTLLSDEAVALSSGCYSVLSWVQ